MKYQRLKEDLLWRTPLNGSFQISRRYWKITVPSLTLSKIEGWKPTTLLKMNSLTCFFSRFCHSSGKPILRSTSRRMLPKNANNVLWHQWRKWGGALCAHSPLFENQVPFSTEVFFNRARVTQFTYYQLTN